MEDEQLSAIQALYEELSMLKDELREAKSGSGGSFISKASQLSASIDGLSCRLGEMEESRISELSALRTDISGLNLRLNGISASVDASFLPAISGLERKIDSAHDALSSSASASALQLSAAEDLRREVGAMAGRLESLSLEVKSAAESSYAALEKAEGLHSSSKSAASADVAALCHELAGLSQTVASHSHQVSQVASRLDSVDASNASVAALQKELSARQGFLQHIERKLSSALSTMESQKKELSVESSNASKFEELAAAMQNELSIFSRELGAQTTALDSMSNAIEVANGKPSAAEHEPVGPQLDGIRKTLAGQSQELARVNESVSSIALSGAFFGKSKSDAAHADSHFAQKLDSISQGIAHANENLSSISSQFAGASPLIHSLGESAGSLSREASRMQSAFLSLQGKALGSGHAAALDLSTIEFQLEQLTGEMRQLQKAQPKPSASAAIPANAVMPASAAKELSRELASLRSEFQSLSLRLNARHSMEATELSKAFAPLVKELHEVSTKVSQAKPAPKDAAKEAKVDLSPVLRKIEGLHMHISALAPPSLPESPVAPSMPQDESPAPLSPHLAAEFNSLREQLSQLSSSVSAVQSSQMLAPATMQADLSPILAKLDEIKSARAAVSDEASLAPVLQQALFEEMRQELELFKSFDLSDRAKLVVGRLDSLAAKGSALAGH
ncbi:MAG: hypothetical protein V1708_02990 [Candidatus Micrarchaeota archaeon]